MPNQPRFHLVLGPSGAGKSTLSAQILEVPFFDLDLKLQFLSGGQTRNFSGEVRTQAAQDYDIFVHNHLQQKTNYGLQRTFTHADKDLKLIERPKQQGFKIAGTYVCAGDLETHLRRAGSRLHRGGHHVPENEVKTIYQQSLRNMPRLLENAAENQIDTLHIVDSHKKFTFRSLLSIDHQQVISISKSIPAWLEESLAHTPFNIEKLRSAEKNQRPIAELDIHGAQRRSALAVELHITRDLKSSDGAMYRTNDRLLDDMKYVRDNLVRGVTPDTLRKDFNTRSNVHTGIARYTKDLIAAVEKQIGLTDHFRQHDTARKTKDQGMA